MGQKEIEKRLRQYAAACEEIVPENRERGIRELLQIANRSFSQAVGTETLYTCRTRGTLRSFILEQIGYLGRYCLIWQVVWVVVFSSMLRYGASHFGGKDNGSGILVSLSVLTPLLVLLTVEEVTKVYQRSMLEIEYATKYSLRSAVMIRMAVLCAAHAVILTVCILCMHVRVETDMGRLLVYGFTPMILMTAVLFWLMQHWQGDLLRHTTAAVYALAVGLLMIGNTDYFNWYQPAYFKVWCGVCVAGIVFGVRQFVSLNKKLASYEAIVR